MECVICNEEITKKDIVCLECCHIFHTNCVIMLVKKRTRKCPLCRTKIRLTIPQMIRHDLLYDN